MPTTAEVNAIHKWLDAATLALNDLIDGRVIKNENRALTAIGHDVARSRQVQGGPTSREGRQTVAR